MAFGDQRLLQQHSSIFRGSRGSSSAVGFAARDRGVRGARRLGDARFLGERTISCCRGERVPEEEFDKTRERTKDEPVPTSSNCRITPHSMAERQARAEFRCASRCRARSCYSTDWSRPTGAGAELDPTQVRNVEAIAVSEYCACVWRSSWRSQRRIAVVPLGIAMDGYSRRELGPPESGPHVDAATFRVGTWPRRRRRRAAPPGGGVCPAASRMGGAPARLDVAGYMAADQRRYLDAARGVLAQAGLQDGED